MLSISDDNYCDKTSKSSLDSEKVHQRCSICRCYLTANSGRPNILEWQEQHFSTLPSWLTEKLGKCMYLGSRIDTEEDFGANNLKH